MMFTILLCSEIQFRVKRICAAMFAIYSCVKETFFIT